ncbi:MAG: 3-oxoacyl-ACP reductase FabG [Candidatus Poribacteria bacterium]|nr:3-oxoacyl-ACP reductase FabG [Candidatus Poribacteria bacterium]
MKLKNKISVVTGGSKGIGAAISIAFAREGSDVLVGYNASENEAKMVAEEIQALGRKSIAVKVDVSCIDQVDRMVETALDTFGRINVLANVAGITFNCRMKDLPEEEWDRIIDTNLKGTFLCSQAVGKVMIENGGGSIVNMSSVAGHVPQVAGGPYSASKAGVNMLSKVLALEWAEHNIRVNSISPGPVETEMVRYVYNTPELRNKRKKTIPLNRFAQPEEIASAAVFLASDDSGYTTGHCLVIDGGFLDTPYYLTHRLLE